MTKYFVISALFIALFVAGCQEEPIQPPDAVSAMDDVAAIRLIESEIFDASHDTGRDNRNFIGILSGRNEVPETDSRGRGVAKFKVAKDGLSIDYRLIVANISNVVGAHIHRGAAGSNGPVVFGLFSDTEGGGRTCGPIAQGSFTPADLVGPYAGSTDFTLFLSDLHSDSLYVNVHTNDGIEPPNTGRGDYPGGEIRGQLNGHRHHDDRDGHDGKGDDDGDDDHDGGNGRQEGRDDHDDGHGG